MSAQDVLSTSVIPLQLGFPKGEADRTIVTDRAYTNKSAAVRKRERCGIATTRSGHCDKVGGENRRYQNPNSRILRNMLSQVSLCMMVCKPDHVQLLYLVIFHRDCQWHGRSNFQLNVYMHNLFCIESVRAVCEMDKPFQPPLWSCGRYFWVYTQKDSLSGSSISSSTLFFKAPRLDIRLEVSCVCTLRSDRIFHLFGSLLRDTT